MFSALASASRHGIRAVRSDRANAIAWLGLVLAIQIVAEQSFRVCMADEPSVALCEVGFGRQRRLRTGLLAAPPKRYVRCLVDVNDVSLRALAVGVGVGAQLRGQQQFPLHEDRPSPAWWPALADRPRRRPLAAQRLGVVVGSGR
jgi:hypothetical protein